METVTEFLQDLASKGVKLSAEAGRLNCYAQKGALTDYIRDGISRYKSEIIALLEDRQRLQRAQTDNSSSRKSKEFPLSVGEKGLYILQKLRPEMSAYNVPLCFKIDNEVNTEMLGKAWEYALEQFPILTARVIEKDGGVFHLLDDGCKTTIQRRTIDSADDQQLLSFLRNRVKEPFDLNRGPLTRAELFTRDKQKSVLLITVHHIVFDGTSAMILLRSLLEFYRQLCEGKPVRLSSDLLGYQEFVAWEEAMLTSAEGAAHAGYWQRRLEGELPAIELLPDSPRPAAASFEGKTLVEDLPEDLSHWVHEFSKAHSLPPSVIFLGMFQLLLHRYTSQDDIIVGMPVMGRAAQKFGAEVGFFINMVPIRIRCDEGLKLSEFLRRAQGVMLDALYHSSYPFPLMLEKLKAKQVRINPVYQVTYAYQNFIAQADFALLQQQQTLNIEHVTEITQEEDSDFGLEIYEKGALFSAHLKYNSELFSQQAIERLFGHYCALLRGASESGDLLLSEYSIVTEYEKQRLLYEWNGVKVDYPPETCIHQLFEAQVVRTPDAIAVVDGESHLTYGELNRRANKLARSLLEFDVGPEALVAALGERGIDFLTTILAIFKTGGAYVPLDPEHPAQRVGQVIGQSGATLVITSSRFGSLAADAVAGLAAENRPAVCFLEELLKAPRSGENLGRHFHPGQLAYVIFTSGSTGVPKGAMVEQRGMLNHLYAKIRDLPLGGKDVVAQTASQCFDISVWQFLAALLVGSQVRIFNDEITHDPALLLDQIELQKVTILEIVPSMMRMALAEADHRDVKPDLSTLRWLIPTGEALPPELCRHWFRLYPEIPLLNAYGPTECSDDVTHCPIAEDLPEGTLRTPIGRPICNTQIYVFNSGLQLQPIGIVGELYVGGVGVGRGYLNDAEKTSETFVPDVFGINAGARLYKSGDLVRYLSDGNLEYLSRSDHQVKIRGFRIELGEIEAALGRHPSVKQAVVVAREDRPGEKNLVAYLVAKSEKEPSISELRDYLKLELPEYMVPTAYVPLDALPLTENGKLDRRALPSPEGAILESERGYVAPRTQAEERLAEIWSQVLGVDRVGVHDNFFELGGHSLLATQLVSKIRSRLGVDLPLKALFEGGSVAQMAQLIVKAEKSDIPPIRPVDRGQFDRLPLSFAQERLWFINQLEPESDSYNCPGAVTISGELDIDQLEQAFNLIIERHENLRTLFPSRDGQARQLILDSLDFTIEHIDLSHYKTKKERDDKAKQLCLTEAATPFDLARGPLIRGKVIKLAVDERVLMLNMHHIISDGWSVGVLIEELGVIMEALRQGRQAGLAPLPIQYVDYSVWQRNWLEEGGVLKRQLAYWQEKLSGVPESLDLVTDHPRPNVRSFAGATKTFALDAQLTGQLKRLADEHGVTLYMVLLAAFKVLLHRYTGQNDICVGSPIANRQYGETEGLIGMFVNILALRSQVESDDTFAALLAQVKTTFLEAYEHQDAPFEKVVDLLQPQRNLAISPLFQVTITVQNTTWVTPNPSIQPYSLDSGVSKFDLSFDFTETAEGLAGSIEYSTALYKRQTIGRMVEHFIALCQAIAVTPDAKVRDLDYLSEAEKRRLLRDYNATRAEYPKDKCIHQLFAEQAAVSPENTAVVVGEQELSYRELYNKSHDLALYLQSQGVKPDGLVCVCMERSLDMVVGLLGILRAGGAYAPLDPSYPDERLAYMLRDSGAAIVLTDHKIKGRLSALSAQDGGLVALDLVALDEEWPSIVECATELKAQNVELNRDVKPHHLAYVIYTSGSTGQPKGVMVEHQNLANLVEWHRAAFGLCEGDVSTGIAGVGFDAAAWEIWPALCVGATLTSPVADVLRNPEALLKWWETLRIDVSFLSTPLAEFAFSRRITNPHLRTLLVGGDELHQLPSQPESFLVVNNYGPTECAVVATSGVLRSSTEVLHIGRPISNAQVYILDAHQQLVPIGVAGEIYIGGAGVARGYLNLPELTAERFLRDPFSNDADARMYRTGDLGRWLDDGAIQYLGRIDTQVKIRGFRIELGEIEARLNQHPGVQGSAVIARGQDANKQLVAFYRAKDTTADQVVQLPDEELRAHLLHTLPDYMAPAAFVSLAAIPLNPNGKVDRRALARMDVTIGSGREYLAPRTETEKQLVGIWAEVLNLAPEKIGVDDNFFELGGHSLLATQLISKIRSRLDVDLPLKALFERGSVAQLAQLIANAEKSDIPPIRPVDRGQFDRLPLSFAQERLWFINQLEPDSPGYNVPGAAAIQGELDIDQLEQAFNLIIERHENLRTFFPSQEGLARQQILDRVDFKLERIDLSHNTDKNARDNEAMRLCRSDAATPFDLARGPLIRGKVIKLAVDEHVLMLNMHHIISDGWSVGVLIKELGVIMEAFRQGRRPELAPLPIQYADYSVWQRNWLEEGGVLTRQLAYWQEKLAGVPESLDLATDYPRPNVQSFAGATKTFALDAQLTGQLKRLADEHGVTLYMVLLAAFKVLLHRYTGQEDLCVGSPIANRQYGETEGLIGMFVNTLALRSQVAGDDTFAALLAQVKATCLEAYEHQDAPFEKVVETARLQRNMAVSPLFQVMLILQNVDEGAPDQHIQPYPLENGISKFDLTVEFTEAEGGLAGAIEYSTALYKPQTIARMAGHLIALCRAITVTPAAKIRDLDYLGAAEKLRLLVEYNATQAEYPKDKCIHHLFEEQVAVSPDSTAVVFGGQSLNYRELYNKSHDLALYLQSQGVGPDSIVGLCLERSLEMMVGIMGTALAGGSYLPLDPDYPDERLTYMLQDSGSSVVLTHQEWGGRIGALSGGQTRIVALDAQWSEVCEKAAALKRENVELRRDVGPHNLCYVIYTSGSTGKPKGVLTEHRALVNRIHWMQKRYALDRSDVVLQKTPYSFDVSVWEFFWPMVAGASVVFAVPGGHKDVGYLEDLINNAKITTLHYVPSMLNSFLENARADCGGVRRVFCSGEALDKKAVDRYKSRFPNAVMHNLYGPTEAAIDVTAFDCSQLNYPFVPIGAPIDNTQIYILDRNNQPQPIGAPGELHIAGDGLARGYLNRPELTQEKFVANPFAPGARMYKTGDLARWLDGGDIQYLGRIDTQVKIRGFRIELGEIEARLNERDEIQDSAVVARGEGADKRLIAFYRAKDTTADQIVHLPQEELRGHLLRTLPEYMAPAAFVSLAAIPLSPNGKVDRRALERMDVAIESSREYLAPRNETEERLVGIWAEVLNLAPEKIGVDDNFFELGGHSLLAARLMAKMNRHFKQTLPLATLFAAPNISSLAKLISSEEAPSFDILVPIQADGDAPPVFAVPGVGGNVLSLQPLSKVLGAKQPLFALQAVGLDGKTPPLDSVEQTAQANISALKMVQPVGPYSLIGHSYGGVVAYEMARILLERGEGVSSLVLLDSIAPSVMQGKIADDEAAELFKACSTIANLYGVHLKIDLNRLRQSSSGENIQYIVSLLNDRGLDIDGEQVAAFYRVYRANLLCYRAYIPSMLSRKIDVSLYCATQGRQEGPGMPRDYGWNRLLQNPIRVYYVEADHFSILEKVRLQEEKCS